MERELTWITVLKNGFGRDIYRLTFEQITTTLHVCLLSPRRTLLVFLTQHLSQIMYACSLLYQICLVLTKLSILLFYLAVFPYEQFLRVVHATLVFTVGVGIAYIVAITLQCQPISYNWTAWDGEHTGHCYNLNAAAWANAGVNIGLDMWILALPVAKVVRLNISWKKKLSVCAMFAVGIW